MNQTEILNETIKTLMKDLGIRPNLKGYRYAIDAVLYVVTQDDGMAFSATRVYQAVADRHGTTVTRVERGIRHAITRMYDTCEPDVLARVFGARTSIRKGKLTNKEFLWTLAEYFSATPDADQIGRQ